MVYSTLILTAGISTLAPRNVIGEILRTPNSPVEFPDSQQNPIAKDPNIAPDILICQCLEYVNTALDDLLRDEINVKSISAEFSMLQSLLKEEKVKDNAQVIMVHTPSLGGKLAVELQKWFWDNEGITIQAEELSIPFDPAQRGGLALASGAFIGTISRLLQGHTPHQTAFAPIGGYKVMVALGHVAASFHGFSSLYIHEDSQQLQELAPAPVALNKDPSLIALSRKINTTFELSSLTEKERKTLNNYPAYFTIVDDLVGINELGYFLKLNETPITLSKQAHKMFLSHQKQLLTQFYQIRDKALQDIDYPGINHDLTSTKGRNHPWRLAKMGDGIRIVWQLHENQLIIHHIWTDHDSYDKEAKNIVTQNFPSNLQSYISITSQ